MIERIKSNKKLKSLCYIIISLLVVLIIRITYAYLAADVQDGLKDATIHSDTVDTLRFIEGDPLILNATPTTLPENGSNLVAVSKPKVSLIANESNKTATYTYYVYFEMNNNTFVYSDGSTPEIILTIADPNGQVINSEINGLVYGTYSGVSGYDVTTYNGAFQVASYVINSSDSINATIQEWIFTLTYLNQDYDQSTNYGNSLNTKITMQKESRVAITNIDVVSSPMSLTIDTDILYSESVYRLCCTVESQSVCQTNSNSITIDNLVPYTTYNLMLRGYDINNNFLFSSALDATTEKIKVIIKVADYTKNAGNVDEITATISFIPDVSEYSYNFGAVNYYRTNTDEEVGVYEGVLTASYTPNPMYDVTIIPGTLTIIENPILPIVPPTTVVPTG